MTVTQRVTVRSGGCATALGEGDALVEVCMPTVISADSFRDFDAVGRDGIPPDAVRRVLPTIIVLMTDPRGIAALAAVVPTTTVDRAAEPRRPVPF
jgi:hypothetical protein